MFVIDKEDRLPRKPSPEDKKAATKTIVVLACVLVFVVAFGVSLVHGAIFLYHDIVRMTKDLFG